MAKGHPVESLVLLGGLGLGAWWLLKNRPLPSLPPLPDLNPFDYIDPNAFSFNPPPTPMNQPDTPLEHGISAVLSPAIDLFTGTTRGIRANNPTNIKCSTAQTWQGQTGCDGTFVQFNTPIMGIRAAFKIWQTYAGQGYTTPAQIVPHFSNTQGLDLTNYLAVVSSVSGLGAGAQLDTTDMQSMIDFAQGVVAAENGLKWADYYPLSTYQQAWSAI